MRSSPRVGVSDVSVDDDAVVVEVPFGAEVLTALGLRLGPTAGLLAPLLAPIITPSAEAALDNFEPSAPAADPTSSAFSSAISVLIKERLRCDDSFSFVRVRNKGDGGGGVLPGRGRGSGGDFQAEVVAAVGVRSEYDSTAKLGPVFKKRT